MSDTDPEEESEGSAEEIEENIVAGEEGRILKKSRKTRKSRNSLQKCNEAFQDIQAAQAVHSLDASEAAVLEEVEGITEGQLLLQHIDPLGDIVEADAQALASQYGQLTVIQVRKSLLYGSMPLTTLVLPLRSSDECSPPISGWLRCPRSLRRSDRRYSESSEPHRSGSQRNPS